MSEQQNQTKPDVPAIMESIRAKIKAEIDSNGADKAPAFHFHPASEQGGEWKAGALLHSEDLRFLNRSHAYGTTLRVDSITTHRRGIVGKLLVRAKQKFARILRFSIFADYFTSEAEFTVNLVRFLNDVSKYVDSRDHAIFWELIRKIDVDITNALNRIERIADEQTAALRTSEKEQGARVNAELAALSRRIGTLESSSGAQAQEIRTLDSVARGLEGIAARFASGGQLTAKTSGSSEGIDLSYLLLENRYRGSEAEIESRLAVYPEIFNGAPGPVLEIGPGRGELLRLLGKAGIAAYGVDIDAAMVETAKSYGFDSRLEDGLKHLRGLADGSLGGVVAIQVVEHLTRDQLHELSTLCRAKVARGGKVVFETVNPLSLTSLSSNYFRDPTHVFPLHPDTLRYTLTLAGFPQSEVRMLSPVPREAQLKELVPAEFMTPRWNEALELLNENIRRLNSLLYGCQDFCVIAQG